MIGSLLPTSSEPQSSISISRAEDTLYATRQDNMIFEPENTDVAHKDGWEHATISQEEVTYNSELIITFRLWDYKPKQLQDGLQMQQEEKA